MARLILSSGQNFGTIGNNSGVATNVTGTTASETVTVAANGTAVFSADFNRGGDIIKIEGAASLYTAAVTASGSQITLTAANGASIVVPIGTVGTTVVFNGTDSRTLLYDTTLGHAYMGDQALTSGGSVVLTAGTGPNPTGDTFSLTVGADDINGTAGDDTFRARVIQNQNGEQTNALGSGDYLNGGAGDDILVATVQAASALNSGPYSEVSPITVGVETVQITAEQAFNGSGYYFGNENEQVVFSAEEMYGLEKIVSYRSDASLTFYNVNTLPDDTFDDANARSTDAIEICMEFTAGENKLFTASDMTVLFDNDFLLRPGPESGDSRIFVELLDIDNQITSNQPLKTNPFDILYIGVNGVITPVFYDGSNDGVGVAAYNTLIAEINAGLQAAGLTTFTAHLGTTFSANDTDSDPVVNGVGHGFQLVIEDSAGQSITSVEFGASDRVPGDTDYHKQTFAEVDPDQTFLITSNICLQKVGNGSDTAPASGGALTVGAMASGGIERFNVEVKGTSSQPSSLALLTSTNNTLEEVYVTSASGSGADLTIGNAHTDTHNPVVPNGADNNGCDVTDARNNALTDVLIFDASEFANDAHVYANFSSASVGKYMTLTDTQVDAGADNQHAIYTFAGGNDTLSMNLSKDNMAFQGAATREDFTFTANMGAGDDTVLVQIGDGEASNEGWTDTYWYTNHLLNDNLNIATGDGNDFVNTWGSTAARITTGAGDDVIYTDNSGVESGEFNCDRATWVFNSTNLDVENLRSETAASLANVANLTLTVQYMDFEVTVNVGNSAGSVNGVTITDLTINQAIKDAINNDPVLKDFLIAEDGPGRTLIVSSLVDGEVHNSDLTVTLGSSGALSAAQLAGTSLGLTDLSATALAAMGFNPDGSALTTPAAIGDKERWGSDTYSNGFDSYFINNNRVEGGTGNDEIALSSSRSSIEHVVITGAFGTDHILNFSAARDNAVVQPATSEVQTITFTTDATASFNVVVVANGVTYTVPIMAGTPASTIATLVAGAIDPAVNVAAVAAGGVVTLTYAASLANVAPATAAIVSTTPTDTSSIVITGAQTDAANYTVTFGGETFVVAIPAVSFPGAIEQAIITAVQNHGVNVDAIYDGTLDGTFDLQYFGGTSQVGATITITDTDHIVGNNAAIAAPTDGAFTAFTPGTTVATATTIQGAPAVVAAIDYDIFDLSAIIGVGAPGYFHNDQQADGNELVGGVEYQAIDALVDTTANGVLLIDTVDGDAAKSELVELQALVKAADGAAQAAATTSVIITVDNTADATDGLYGNFYQVVDGKAAGDATVSYLGTVYLGGSELSGKEAIGNWDAMTVENFTPLTPTQIIDHYGSVL